MKVLFLFLALWPWVVHAWTSEREEKYSSLLRQYAPVWVHEVGRRPVCDILTRFDFDGDWSGLNNVENADRFPIVPRVYGDVVAETNDTYYLFYGVYHICDYDVPLRELLIASSKHDNDFEGAMVAVEKATGLIQAVETWFHSKFLQFAHSPILGGSQTIDGRIHSEGQTHPVFFVPAKGHGVRMFQKIDEAFFERKKYQIYRLISHGPGTVGSGAVFVSYDLIPLDDFLRYGYGPFDGHSMFDEPQDFGIGRGPIGKFLSGHFSGDSNWARPKPPWSWTDKFDTLRPGAWFFHPAYVFNRHFGMGLSEKYLFNLAQEEMLKVDQATLDAWAIQKVPSYFGEIRRGPLSRFLRKLRRELYKVAEFLFYWLG